jgi:hypothetical protein
MAVEGSKTPLLKLDRHHKAYEIEMQICCCKVDAIKGDVKCYRFKLVDCAAIVDELDAVDWCSIFFGWRGRPKRGPILGYGLELLLKTCAYEIFWL